MQAVLRRNIVSVDDYLLGEENSPIKHEYVDGAVFAMAGATAEHNEIAINITSAIKAHLRGKPCRVFMSDVKVRIEAGAEETFYYPDVMVGCDPRDKHHLYLQYPKLLVEVASESTQRLDRREKRLAYQTIETLEEYLIVSQDRAEGTIYRRSNQWRPEDFKALTAEIHLHSIALRLSLSTVYEGVPVAA